MMNPLARRALLLVAACVLSIVAAKDVVVEVQTPGDGPDVVRGKQYTSEVTLYIEMEDGRKTPSGWSTRSENGGNGRPFTFSPGVGLIEGWTEGVLKMKEGERSWIHVPAEKGYGGQVMGSPGGASPFYIPANSDLLFDIEIMKSDGGDEL